VCLLFLNLVYALKDGGVLILNADDKEVYTLKDKTKEIVLSFGIDEKATIKAANAEIFYNKIGIPEGVMCKVEYKGNLLPLKIKGTIGVSYISAALAAFGVGVSVGMSISRVLDRFSEYKVPPGRLNILQGINDTIIIDDSYNSSPTASEAALRALKKTETNNPPSPKALARRGRKIAVLGDMLELGKYSSEEHKKIGMYAAHSSDYLITVGPRAQLMNDNALEQGMKSKYVKHFDTADEAGEHLKKIIVKGDMILIKGSQSIRMEKAVLKILAHPERKGELLVRQEEEWQKQ